MANIHKVAAIPAAYASDDLVFVKTATNVEFLVPSMTLNSLHGILNDITLSGPTSLHTDVLGTYQLTSPTDEVSYTVSSSDGIVVYDAATYSFTFVASVAKEAVVTINGQNFSIEIFEGVTNPPSIQMPVNGSVNIDPAALTLVSSAFSVSNPNKTDVHQSSDWEISTDPDFVTIVASSYNDTVNLTSFPVPSV